MTRKPFTIVYYPSSGDWMAVYRADGSLLWEGHQGDAEWDWMLPQLDVSVAVHYDIPMIEGERRYPKMLDALPLVSQEEEA